MKNKTDILFILHCPPPVHGSSIVGQQIRNSTVINDSFDCRYINLLVSRTVTETGKTSLLKILHFIGVWFMLVIEIMKKKPDVCYLALTTTGSAFYKDVLLVAVLRFFNVKKVYHLHNKGVSKNQFKKINKLLYNFVFKNADVILLSTLLYPDIKTFVPISRIHICPNGIETLSYEPRLVSKNKPVRIIFLSNLIESKGVFILLDACSILHKNGIDFICDFVGAEGDLNVSQFHEKVIQMHLSDKVKYLGKKYGKEKQEILTTAEIFAFPTFYSNECFPLVLLEAMSAGLPVISTFEGGIPDIVEDGVNGFLVPQKNVEILADKLETLIKNPELRLSMGNAGRLKFEKEFKLETFERRMVEILVNIKKLNE